MSTQLRCRYADIVAINSTHVGVLYEAGDTSFADRIQVRRLDQSGIQVRAYIAYLRIFAEFGLCMMYALVLRAQFSVVPTSWLVAATQA